MGWLNSVARGVLILLVSLSTTICSDGPFQCVKKDDVACGCVFKDSNNKSFSISLSGIDRTGGKAYFEGVSGKLLLFKYSLNPCTGFTYTTTKKNTECSDVTGCQITNNGLSARALGLPGQEKFGDYTAGKPLDVSYVAGKKGRMDLLLTCDAQVEGKVESIDDTSLVNIYIKITSKHVCPQPYSPQSGKTSGGSGLSIGSVLVIVFFVILVTYFVGGILFMKYQREASGRDLVPNVQFWYSLPALIKDGCVFFGKKMKGLCQHEEYDQI